MYRHPELMAHLNFSELSSQMSGSEFMLLHWSEEDKSQFPSATELGADLSLSTELFKDLQVTYHLNFCHTERLPVIAKSSQLFVLFAFLFRFSNVYLSRMHVVLRQVEFTKKYFHSY